MAENQSGSIRLTDTNTSIFGLLPFEHIEKTEVGCRSPVQVRFSYNVNPNRT